MITRRSRRFTRIRYLATVAFAALALAVVAGPNAHATGTGSTYVSVNPVRLLDTRTAGAGGTDVPLGPGATTTVRIAGQDGVPSNVSQVTAVVVNITAVNATAASFLTVYPDGTTMPPTSNVDFGAGQTTANMVVVPVGADGSIAIYNHAGSTDALVDLVGYHTPSTSGSTYNTISPVPVRVLDTRNGTGEINNVPAPISTGSPVTVTVEGGATGIPTTGVSAVVLNLTAVNSTANSYLTAYAQGSTQPSTSSLDFTPGETVANLVVVPVPAGITKIAIANHVGSTDAIVDLFGYYTTGTGATFTPLSPPTRLLDTRTTGTPLSPQVPQPLQIAGVAGVPNSSTVTAAVLHVTVINPTQNSFLTVYADGTSQPGTSNLNYVPGQLISNLIIAPVGSDGKIDLINHVGTTDVVVDISGYYN